MIYKYDRVVKYYETDRMGVVHHSNYIRWFEEARVEFMQDEGIMVPVVTVECKYKNPVTFDDEVTVNTKVRKFNGIVIELEYEVVRTDDGSAVVTGASSHCFVDAKTFKPLNLKRERADMYDKFIKAMED